jgi:hypothetical protein
MSFTDRSHRPLLARRKSKPRSVRTGSVWFGKAEGRCSGVRSANPAKTNGDPGAIRGRRSRERLASFARPRTRRLRPSCGLRPRAKPQTARSSLPVCPQLRRLFGESRKPPLSIRYSEIVVRSRSVRKCHRVTAPCHCRFPRQHARTGRTLPPAAPNERRGALD